MQALELALRQGVEVDPAKTLLRTRTLQPTEQNLRGTRIGDGALAQTALDLSIGRRLALTARCTALAAQPCGIACLVPRPPMRSGSVLISFRVSDSVSFVQLGRERSPPRDGSKPWY
jgi:hypothetical protein